MTRFSLAALIGFWASVGFGADVLWIRLTPNFLYKDLTFMCTNEGFPSEIYFSAEINEQKVTRALLRKGRTSLDAPVALTPEEVAPITLHVDKTGQYWLKEFPLTSRIVNWVFYNTSIFMNQCSPTQPIKTLEPSPYTYRFETEGLGETGQESSSQKGRFSGVLRDGSPYVAKLAFLQQQAGGEPRE